MKEKRHERRRALIAIACAAVLAFGAVLSALTATDTATNKFALSEGIDLRVVEAFWQSQPDTDGDGVPDHAEGILPTQRIAKDPAIENLTSTPVYVFMEVSIPKRAVVVADDRGDVVSDGTVPVELFSFEAKDGWTLGGTTDSDSERVYRYYYDEELAGNATTPTLFDSVRMTNVQDPGFAADDAILQVIINGHGVQTTGFAGPAEALDAYFGKQNEDEDIITVNLTVNDPSIMKDAEYDLVKKPTTTLSTMSAAEDDQVVFPNVALEKGENYVVEEENGNPVVDFTVDEEFVTSIENGNAAIGEGRTTPIDARDNLNEYSVDELQSLSDSAKENPTAYEHLIGQTMPMDLGTYGTQDVMLIGMNHDDLADGSGKAGLTFQTKNAIEARRVHNSSSPTMWYESELSSYLNVTFLNSIDSKLSSNLKSVSKTCGDYIASSVKTISTKVFLPSCSEVYGSLNEPSKVSVEGEQYAAFTNPENYIKENISTGNKNWWMRSPYMQSTMFGSIQPNGSVYYRSASDSIGVAPCFCI